MEPCNLRLSGNLPCVERVLRTQNRGKGGIGKVYIGVKEPEKFVGENEGRRRLEEAGVEVVHVAGMEEEILKVATAGHVEDINTAPDVHLFEHQKTILWSDDAVLEDPVTIAKGRKQYEAQWYGLLSACSEIECLRYRVMSASNPIEMELEMQYTIKNIGMAKVIESVVRISLDDAGIVVKVEDKWNGELPESSFVNALRRLDAVIVPNLISIPQDKEEDQQRGHT
ncbi:hypothetical protein H2203_000939 [Taxawa tesnikishii (nom. ined.)]|nr:hypothetical protein H2203_000939 [Dothideales sp. JES 119]